MDLSTQVRAATRSPTVLEQPILRRRHHFGGRTSVRLCGFSLDLHNRIHYNRASQARDLPQHLFGIPRTVACWQEPTPSRSVLIPRHTHSRMSISDQYSTSEMMMNGHLSATASAQMQAQPIRCTGRRSLLAVAQRVPNCSSGRD